MAATWLIAGLGNPGNDYKNTRHNAGFIALDAYRECRGFSSWQNREGAELSQGEINGDKVFLVKPQEYMNRSGGAIARVASFYKITPENILVVHDELDIPFGEVQFKNGGGVAGHNGLKSIVDAIGSRDFLRLRIGIGKPENPHLEIKDWVLQRFASEEIDSLQKIVVASLAQGIDECVTLGVLTAQGKFNKKRFSE